MGKALSIKEPGWLYSKIAGSWKRAKNIYINDGTGVQVPQKDQLTASVDARLGVGSTLAVEGQLYSAKTDGVAYTRNVDFWAADVDISCVSVWNNRSPSIRRLTAITPRHAVGAEHYNDGYWDYAIGDVYGFLGMDNTYHTVTIEGLIHNTNHSQDMTIAVFDSDLPTNITPVKVLPENWGDYIDRFNDQLPDSAYTIPALTLNKNFEGIVPIWNYYVDVPEAVYERMAYVEGQFYTNPEYSAMYRRPSSGDSGNPQFFISEGKPLLLSHWTGPTAGPAYVGYVDEVNAAIVTLDGAIQTGYTIEEGSFPDDGGWKKVNRIHIKDDATWRSISWDLPQYSVTITDTEPDLDLFTYLGSPDFPVHIILTVSTGATLYSTDPTNGACFASGPFAAGTYLEVINRGEIYGSHGAGGQGGQGALVFQQGNPGARGGTALDISQIGPTEIDNTNGLLFGGGGGGGGGSGTDGPAAGGGGGGNPGGPAGNLPGGGEAGAQGTTAFYTTAAGGAGGVTTDPPYPDVTIAGTGGTAEVGEIGGLGGFAFPFGSGLNPGEGGAVGPSIEFGVFEWDITAGDTASKVKGPKES